MLKKNVINFIGCDKEYEDAQVVLYGAPFDSTTSFRPGTRFAGQAIRNESYGLETYSPYQDRDLLSCHVFDSGDLELAIGDSRKVLEAIEERTEKILHDGKLPFLIGGEHLVSLGSIRAVARKYPDLHVIHLDAHTDLREDYLGVTFSHACVIRRCWEILGDGKIYQFGIRSGEKEEFSWASEGHTILHPFDLEGLEETIKKLEGKPVYFTVDLDVLDPSVFPGTGTPEPGGIDYMTLQRAVTAVCQNVELVGCDVNELCPAYDASGVSTAVACKIIREMLLAIGR